LHGKLAQHLRSSQPKGHPPTRRATWGNLGKTRGGVGKEEPVELDSSPTL